MILCKLLCDKYYPMKYIYPICLLLILPLLMVSCKVRKLAKPDATPTVMYRAPLNFRVVGYLLSGDIAKGRSAGFDLARINYLNIFFNGPDTNGKFVHIPHLDSTITAAHKYHVKVLATIGNGIKISLLTDTNRARLIDSLVSSVTDLQLDGIDVDLEGNHINKDYEGFVGDLSAALKAKGKLMTAAIATWESVQLTDKALTYFDFLNVMTYDATGPWNLKEPGPHSPYSMAVSDLDFWTNFRCIPKDKLNLGLPFYGYGFGPSVKQEFHYSEIVKLYSGSENTDQIADTVKNVIYYNGLATIKKKTIYAIQHAGGVMIWELMGDADGDKSLLNAVDSTIAGMK